MKPSETFFFLAWKPTRQLNEPTMAGAANQYLAQQRLWVDHHTRRGCNDMCARQLLPNISGGTVDVFISAWFSVSDFDSNGNAASYFRGEFRNPKPDVWGSAIDVLVNMVSPPSSWFNFRLICWGTTPVQSKVLPIWGSREKWGQPDFHSNFHGDFPSQKA